MTTLMRNAGAMLAAAVLAMPALADDVSIRASIQPGAVGVGEQAVLTIEVQGKFRRGSAPELPPLDDFDVFQAGTSQNFSFVNGQASSSITYTYVLSPRREGSYTIEPIRFETGGKVYTASPVTLEVAGAGAAIPAPPSQSPSQEPPPGDLPGQNESIFVSASVDRDTVYVNQQVTWTLGYYTDGRVELLRSPNYAPPTAEGFWVEDLPPQNKYYTNMHGRQFLVSEIKRGFFPTAPGTYTIGEARVDIVVDDFSRRGTLNDFFNRGFGGGFGQARSLQTRPIEVVVLPLPAEGKPAAFQGAVVQDLDVSITADKQMAQVGEPINISVTMSGVGNMRTLSPPDLGPLKEFKVYESGSSTDSFKKDYVVSGRRKFDFVLVPQAEGHFTIPPVSLPYFDPARGAYATARSASIPVDIQPGTHEDGRKLVYAGGGDDFQVINRDIRYIHTPPAVLAPAPPPFYAGRMFLVLQALPLLAVGASLIVERNRRRYRQDAGFARANRALRDAERRLSEAGRAFRGGDAGGGFGRVHAAIFGYFADKMNVPSAGLTAGTIESYLGARKVPDEPAQAIARAIAACDAARYAAGAAASADGASLVGSARDALVAVEKAIR